jgi:hypothetical protein
MFIYLVGFGYRYNICTIGEQRDVDEGRLCLGGLQYMYFFVQATPLQLGMFERRVILDPGNEILAS